MQRDRAEPRSDPQYEEALAVLREGLDIRRALADSDAAHTDDLARELTHSARCARSYHEPELARRFAAEALAVCREHPDSTSRHTLLQALQELSAAHEHLGEFEPAVALGEDALALLDELIADDPRYVATIVTELEQHAVLLHRVGGPRTRAAPNSAASGSGSSTRVTPISELSGQRA